MSVGAPHAALFKGCLQSIEFAFSAGGHDAIVAQVSALQGHFFEVAGLAGFFDGSDVTVAFTLWKKRKY